MPLIKPIEVDPHLVREANLEHMRQITAERALAALPKDIRYRIKLERHQNKEIDDFRQEIYFVLYSSDKKHCIGTILEVDLVEKEAALGVYGYKKRSYMSLYPYEINDRPTWYSANTDFDKIMKYVEALARLKTDLYNNNNNNNAEAERRAREIFDSYCAPERSYLDENNYRMPE